MSGCNSNNTSPVSLNIQYGTSQNCFDCGNECGGQIYNSKCIIYTGPNLGCSGVNTNDSLETALQKIDEQICAIIGDYSTYNMNCLPTWWGEAITTQEYFVDAITGYACETQEALDTFINSTFDDYQTASGARFTALEVPGITCALAGVVNTDTLVQVLNKYCIEFTTLNNKFDISEVIWDNCFTVVGAPTTLPTAFQLLADQICDTKTLITNYGLPLFNNTTTCLGGTSSDTLVTTIGLIIDRLCVTPTFNINTLDWGCITQPTVTQTDLQNAFQTVLDTLSILTEATVTWSEDFTVTANDPENPCAGIAVSLATPPIIDRFVAATALDDTPGTLEDKLVAGDNVTLDFSAETSVTINVDLGDVYKVKADASEADGDAGYLIDKVEGGTDSGITIIPTYSGADKKVLLSPSLDPEAFWYTLYTYIKGSSAAQELFCDLANACPILSTSSLTWLFENEQIAYSGANILTVTNITNPSLPSIVFTTSLSTVTSSSSSSPISLINSNLYLVEVTRVSPNNFADLTVIDETLSYTLYTTTEFEITNPNSFIFTASAGHTYSVAGLTGNNT